MQQCLRRLAPLPERWQAIALQRCGNRRARAIYGRGQGYSTATQETSDDRGRQNGTFVTDLRDHQHEGSSAAQNETDPIFELLLEGYSTAQPPRPPPIKLNPPTERRKLRSNQADRVRSASYTREAKNSKSKSLRKRSTQSQDKFKVLTVAPARYRLIASASTRTRRLFRGSTVRRRGQGVQIHHPLAKYIYYGKGRHPSSQVQGAWQTAYNMIIARFTDTSETQRQPEFHPDAATFASRLVNQSWRHSPTAAVRYRDMHGNWPDFEWRFAALWLMHVEPERLTAFLRSTHGQVHIPALWIADCYQFFATYISRLDDKLQAQELALETKASLALSAQRPREDPLVFLGGFVRLLMFNLPSAETQDLFHMIKKHNIKVHWNTLLHASEFFSRQGDLQTAIAFLLDAHQMGASWETRHVTIACAQLLRTSLQQPQGFELCQKLCKNLQQAGLQLSADIINVLMLGAVDAGEVDLARDMFHEFFTATTRPNKYTFVTLMKAFLRQPESAEELEMIAQHVLEDIEAKKDPIVALKLLKCSIELNIQHADHTSWTKIARMYDHLFDTTPLRQLGLPLPSDLTNKPAFSPADSENNEEQSIHMMIHAYMTLDRLGHTNIRPLLTIYNRFKALVDGGIYPFTQLASTDHVYNSFLRGFTSKRRTLIHAAAVMKDMQTQPEDPLMKKAEPTSQTWNIFLFGFRKNGLTALAEQVLERMQRAGIAPTQETWNDLAQGYANEQNAEGFLDTVRRAEQSGAVWDNYMQNGLSRFNNRERLLRALEKTNMKRALDFSGDLKQSIGARLDAVESDGEETPTEERLLPNGNL